jgi:small-conductance mechanosensitive channel
MKDILREELFTLGDLTLTAGDLLKVILIISFAYLLIRIVSTLIERRFRKKTTPDGRHYSIIQLVKYLVWTVAVVFVIQSLGINITFLVASSAALLVGIGLGLQNVFKDFISGVIILIEGTIKVDDVVEVAGMVAQVKEISIRTSKVVTREDIHVIIPNHKFIEENVVNWTHSQTPTRFNISVGVDYSSDPRVVENILLHCSSQHPDILLSNPAYKPHVRFQDFGNSSLDFQLFFYSHNLFRIETVKSQIRYLIIDEFRKHNVSIPFPQRVIHYATDKPKSQPLR